MIINLTKNLDASEHSKPCIHNFDGSITALWKNKKICNLN
jgi:hypothetical protein